MVNRSAFSWSQFNKQVLECFFSITSLFYLSNAFLQQFIRAIAQVSLQKFIQDKKGYYAILMSSFVFSIMHAHIGVVLIVITVFASYIFGLIFSRTYNLVGVTLVHFILGYYTLSLLGDSFFSG